ncbi:WcaF family extracellular polysaccharide biosynthesis acetyltransferase [Vicingaceae bacterium]|nr:WcaF family extracellular polysaccharide biosynthesis acetyltransferase [Vicingaceae bacterium]MDB4060478.1 WcaF family extracellular polysaccharide biosynthesis acetyltransferase [Vicingaceae bacterium]
MSTKVDLSSFNNDCFQPGGSPVKRLLWYFMNAIIFNSALFPLNALKVNLLRWFGARIGKGVVIKPKVSVKYPWKLSIGDYSWIGEGVWIDNLAPVTIEDNCCISQGAMLLTGNHDYAKASFDLMVGDIHLKSGAWVGAKTVVCPVVTLHENAILSVGSIASKDLKANGIYRGNPAVFIKERQIKE